MLKAFSIIGLLASVLIIGWLAAMYLTAATGPMTVPVSAPANGEGGTGLAIQSPLNAARQLASMDMERQRKIEDLSN